VHRRSVIGGLAAAGLVVGCRDSAQDSPIFKHREARAKASARPDIQSVTFKANGLTDLMAFASLLSFDIRYATANNFMGKPLYKYARALLVQPAAEALVSAAESAKADGYRIAIYDAYRPLSVTQAMWDATPRHLRNYVANPAKGSKHNRGAAVDVTLYDAKTVTPVLMPTDFDDFSKKAHRDYRGAPAAAIANRERLERYMVAAGFRPMSNEWWHFDFIGWEKFPILDIPFEALQMPNAYLEPPS
jgi:zinc D-Ala-D-Ala dipeptidase